VNPSPEGIPARPPDVDHPQIGGGKSRSGSLEKPICSKTKLVFGICLSHKKNIPSSPDTFLYLSTPFNTKLVHLFFMISSENNAMVHHFHMQNIAFYGTISMGGFQTSKSGYNKLLFE
jgi:hypothetical protein